MLQALRMDVPKKLRENVVPSTDRQALRLLDEKNYLKNKVPRGYRL